MKIVVSHPHGNINTIKVVSLFQKLKFLNSFCTTFLFPIKFFFFNNRNSGEISLQKIRIYFIKELFRLIFNFFHLKKLYFYENSYFSVNSVYKDLDLKVSRYLKKNFKNINVIYSYEDCSLNSFQFAKNNGIRTIYDLTSPYWRLKEKILNEEIKLQPEWKLSSTEVNSKQKCLDKDKEIFLSDQIVVASTFSAKSLELYNEKKLSVEIIPYGSPTPITNVINDRKINDKLKIIFAGRPLLSKGFPYLIESLTSIDLPWELEIAGSIPEKPELISKKLFLFLRDNRCKFLGQISNNKLLEKMRNSHIFIFPSIYEGFGQVLLEAMSCGLPVITTENTGGPDFIKDCDNGFVTKIRDTKRTIEIINNLYNNEELRRLISKKAINTANKLNWNNYSNKLKNVLLSEK
jgi:glycosyltransferase involved in cell wall biosynthesis